MENTTLLQRLDLYMIEKGLNDNIMTKEAKLSNGLLGKTRKSTGGLSSDTIEKILNAYTDLNAEWWLRGTGRMVRNPSEEVNSPSNEFVLQTDQRLQIQKVPLFEFHAAAGLVELFGDHKNILDYIVIPNLPKCDGAMFITGDSMYPLLKSGDIACWKAISDMQDGIMFGEMHILSVYIDNDLKTVVKYIQKSKKGDEYIKLVSHNSYHAERDVHLKNVSAIALVKASIRLNSMM